MTPKGVILSIALLLAAGQVRAGQPLMDALERAAFEVAQARGASSAQELEQTAVRDTGYEYRRLELAYQLGERARLRTSRTEMLGPFADLCARLDRGKWDPYKGDCSSPAGGFYFWVRPMTTNFPAGSKVFYETLNVFEPGGDPLPPGARDKTSAGPSDPLVQWNYGSYRSADLQKLIQGQGVTIRGVSRLSAEDLAQRVERDKQRAEDYSRLQAKKSQPKAEAAPRSPSIQAATEANQRMKMGRMLEGLEGTAQELEKGCEATGGVAYRSAVGASPTTIQVMCRGRLSKRGTAWIDLEHSRICFQIRNYPTECSPSY